MTELNPTLPAVHRFNFPRILEVLLQPQRTFAEIAGESHPSWLTPMLGLSISTFLYGLVSGFLKARATSMGEIQLPPDWQYWTPDMQNNFMQAQQATQGFVFVYIIPIVLALTALWLGWLILSGLLHLGSTLLGGRGSMQTALNMVAWASLPFMVRDVLRIIFMLLAGHALVSPGLSGFAGSTVFWAKILSRLDIFFIWNAILLSIGLSAADGLPRAKAVMGVTAILIVILLALAGIGTLTSGLGGLTL